MTIWSVTADEICRLQGRDAEMTAIMNGLLCATAGGSLAPAALRLTVKTQEPDGGIDAAVDGAVPAARDPSGFLAVPTCWQFKACLAAHIKARKGKNDAKGGQEKALRAEIRKPYCRRLLREGYGYRFCITDCLTPEKRQRWETWLSEEARAIHPDALPPRVVDAVLLAQWCSCYAGIVRQLRPFLSAVHDFTTWARLESAESPKFVDVESRHTATAAIRAFADLAMPATGGPVLTVSGEAGIGKSRCVVESVRTVPGIAALVVATDSESAAVDVIHRLLSEPDYRAICVVDGLSSATRSRLSRLLAAETGRLRVIAIDNERREEPLAEGEIRLAPLERQDVERILAANFPEIPNERRWAIADLASGFVRLAVDICRSVHLLPEGGDVAAVVPLIRDRYLACRLSPRQRAVVELVSLLARVGYRGETAHELRGLCAACPASGLTPEEIIATAADIRKAPGFIAVGSRYLYVSPRLVAQAAFRSAWERWVRADPEAFFTALPAALEDALARQIRDAGTEEIRRLFTSFHESWLRRLSPASLCDPATMSRLLRLAEVEPEMILPHLADWIDAATPEQIVGLSHLPPQPGLQGRGWAARRNLVWLAEWLLRFPEFSPFAERILYRLALVETESCGNNATEIWCRAYRPLLSGTAIPFPERLRGLEQRLLACLDEAQLRLCLHALAGPLTADGMAHRMGSPSLISGRMPPPDWVPTTREEMLGVWRATAELVARLARHPRPEIADGVIDATIQHAFGLIRHGYLSELIGVIDSRPLGDARLVALLHCIDQFLATYCRPERRHVPPALEAEVRLWRQRLLPTALRSRVQVTIGRTYFDIHEHNADHGEALLSGLAGELLSDTPALASLLPWLYSDEARSAHALGMHLGRLDERAGLLERLVEAAAGRPNHGLLHGYVIGLLDRHPAQEQRVAAVVDRLMPTQPELVFGLLVTGLPCLRPLDRAFALVDAGRIPPGYLRIAWRLVGSRPLTQSELAGVVHRLLPSIRAGEAPAGQAAIDVLSMQLHAARQARPDAPPFAPEEVPLVLDVLETSLAVDLGGEGWAWGQLVAAISETHPQPAARLAVAAIMSENHLRLSHEVEQYLATAARQHPLIIMQELGAGLLVPGTGWRLGLHDLAPVVAVLPPAITRAWVEEHGHEGARALARLLPPPELREGVPTVSELTAFVLERFGDDDRVFREFCAGAGEGGWRSGDIAGQYDQDARLARQFLTHPCRRIREWAQRADASARALAEWFRADDEEMEAP